MKKIVSIIIMLVVMLMMSYAQVQAGMADFTDAEADAEANRQLQEQQNELSGIENKSTNNFLDSLSVKVNGETVKLDFDKQTINYDIGETDKTTIQIDAKAEDEKATVNGAGNIKLKAGENDIRVDVAAESGTIRTYHIKVVCSSANATNTENTEVSAEISENSEISEETVTENNNNVKEIAISVVIIVCFFAIIYFAIRKKK